MNLIKTEAQDTMNSYELLEIVNAAREKHGESEIANRHFIARIEDELEGELGDRKTFTHPQNHKQIACYRLTKDQCTLVGMRESKAVRRSVLAKLKEVETTALASPTPAQDDTALHLENARTVIEREAKLFKDYALASLDANLYPFSRVANDLNKTGKYERTLKAVNVKSMACNDHWLSTNHETPLNKGTFFVRRDIMPSGGRSCGTFKLKLTELGRQKLLNPHLKPADLVRDYLLRLPSGISNIPGIRKTQIVERIVAQQNLHNYAPLEFPDQLLVGVAHILSGKPMATLPPMAPTLAAT